MNRRDFLTTAAATGSLVIPGSRFVQAMQSASQEPKYIRANTDWLAESRFGIGVHWTAHTVPRKGSPLPFQKAVDAFQMDAFVDAVAHAGANYVLFTTTHALQMLPAPHPIIDKILPGRTCSRDLIDELAVRLAAKRIPLLLYYNHSCNGNDDTAWMRAIGYEQPKKDRFVNNLVEIVSWMGDHYGSKVKAWWFDSAYSLDSRGPVKGAATRMNDFTFPWERLTVAAKSGFPGRLVTYNAGINFTYLYTTHQDYWAGEMTDLKNPAKSRFLDNGLQWFGWTCLDEKGWVHSQRDREMAPPFYKDVEVISFVRECRRHKAPMTFNVGIYQDGTMAPASIEQLHRVSTALA